MPWLEVGHDIFRSYLQCNTGFFDHNEINKMMEESVKMKQFDHPNVMSLIGVCIDAGPAPYIVMPFMVNGSLLSYLRKERPNLLLNETADEDSVSFGLKCCCMLVFNVAAKYLFITLYNISIPVLTNSMTMFMQLQTALYTTMLLCLYVASCTLIHEYVAGT